ncbi:MAG TPA: Hpt domain-containing protein [Candidatus Binataceae bacterium]|nr:Hpt domain-containing protein [Candidatus Binataceae bacterium]
MSASQHPVAIVDPSIRDLVPGFLKSKRADIAGALAALELGEFERARQVGHQLKGDGGAYGFDALTKIGSKFEDAVLARNQAAAVKWARQLIKYLDTVRVRFSDDVS